MRQVERAIFDLRRGLPVLVRANGSDVMVHPLEGCDDEALAALQALSGSQPALALTRHRLARLGIDNDAAAALLPIDAADTAEEVIAWASAEDGRLPADSRPAPASPGARAALEMMRIGLLIPAAVVAEITVERRAQVEALVAEGSVLALPAEQIDAYAEHRSHFLKRTSEAQIPLSHAEESRFVMFREADGMREHIAILIGDTQAWNDAVPVRLHSACLTGDLFGSLRCDCGEQLRESVRAIDERGGGVLLYLAQEGRGIGLANKLRAYTLQDGGLDTVDADQVLGFGEDERTYGVALEMLEQLQIQRIELLTNNPEKLNAMAQGGIEVVNRRGVYGKLTRQNQRYLDAKAKRAGHWLEEVLGQESETRVAPFKRPVTK
ncbi:GTP cyclohydrolase II RibA [Salinicola endophyticus]|uniref:GTP cyclohydrolase-2 n=1 Tax=Salinicola endophyticus TaxID=1949083 RepID=A0ABY8FBH8_9GAMM|nr:GTP cyclohydrolase II RibA [Salinicola endophyticus]WFF40027.1 GTP cyclohydrolase II RibA [Salinicola endophyticus]